MRYRISIRGVSAVGIAAAVAVATAGAVHVTVVDVLVADHAPPVAAEGTATHGRAIAPTEELAPVVDVSRAVMSPEVRMEAVTLRHAGEQLRHAKRAVKAVHEQRARAARSAQRRIAARNPRSVARQMAADRYGWGAGEFSCLDSLWTKESGWNPRADNPTSSAYGIPQALPGSKMASKGADWATNPVTQIAWGLTYVRAVYGTPCAAWSHSRGYNWY